MMEEEKQQTIIGLIAEADTQHEPIDESCEESLIDVPGESPPTHAKSTEAPRSARKRKRTTKAEMDKRNTVIAKAAVEFQARHQRLPTVHEIAAETGYSRRQIYSTTQYKEGKVIKSPSKSASDTVGVGAAETEYRGEQSIQNPTVARRPVSEQIQVDAPVEQQDIDTEDVETIELPEVDLESCYLCGDRIPTGRRIGHKCPRCGKRACMSCLVLVDSPHGVCISCDIKVQRRKAIWDTVAVVGIIIVVVAVVGFALTALFFKPDQALRDPLGF